MNTKSRVSFDLQDADIRVVDLEALRRIVCPNESDGLLPERNVGSVRNPQFDSGVNLTIDGTTSVWTVEFSIWNAGLPWVFMLVDSGSVADEVARDGDPETVDFSDSLANVRAVLLHWRDVGVGSYVDPVTPRYFAVATAPVEDFSRKVEGEGPIWHYLAMAMLHVDGILT